MNAEDDLVESLAPALPGTTGSAPVSDESLDTLEARMGARLPKPFRTLLRRLGTAQMPPVQFQGETVRFSTLDEMVASLEHMELEGAGVVPFAEDSFGSIWFVESSANDPERGGPVFLTPVQERYVDPQNPIERKAETFEDFLRGLRPWRSE